jgi:cyclopropane fatty-acyl-phospholipid synthase-like methyltransferase
MIYTCGVVKDLENEETLEQLQDNKLTVVCEKLGLQSGDRYLDIGCGWGTLVAFAAKNYGCDATGVTLSRNQAKFGNQRIKDNGVDPATARILCKDFREVQDGPGRFNKISSLEMAEVCDTLMGVGRGDAHAWLAACRYPAIWSILAPGLRSPRRRWCLLLLSCWYPFRMAI